MVKSSNAREETRHAYFSHSPESLAFHYTNMPLTISAATPHVRFTEPKKRAQLSPEDRKDRQEARADKQALIDSAVTEWFSNTMALAEELATRHKLKPQYFLDLFFQGGARMIHQQKKVNPYTAFKAEKSAECRERTYTFTFAFCSFANSLQAASPRRFPSCMKSTSTSTRISPTKKSKTLSIVTPSRTGPAP
jgi:hypothetical protein